MKISKITLHNFRIYKGDNTISFSPFNEENIHIIAGKNGYGKTTFLTSLIWVFYGKLIGQVEEKYRKDIKNAGGYSNYLESLINREVKNNFKAGKKNVDDTFFIEIIIKDILIPSLPCESITIKRSYNLTSKEEKLHILIDGIENELTKDVGYELFINDFILPREIAKFFFFDAEKIVSLAEAKTKDELKSLSRAYSEVLGIKKYEELRKNLNSLLTKLIRKGVSENDRSELNRLIQNEQESKDLIEYNVNQQKDLKLEISNHQNKSNFLQEKLIREGNAITLEELLILKKRKEELQNESSIVKSKLNHLYEIVPLVIAGKKLSSLKNQLEKENDFSNISNKLLKKEISQFSKDVLDKLIQSGISNKKEIQVILDSLIKEKFKIIKEENKTNILLDYSAEDYRNFNAIYDNIRSVFKEQFNAIVQEEKNTKILLSRTITKIKQAEARKGNHLAKKIREEKKSIDNTIIELNQKYGSLLIEQGRQETKLNIDKRLLSEFQKKYTFIETDKKKYQVTEKLLEKLNILITKVKEEKKYTLQKALKLSLNKLMHKENFIANVRVTISDDLMDIDLIAQNGNVINKETLSKGEQQLYATALLKALVDESGIQFPVFIDSPLQKFDKYHSINIIEEFYPTISKQVVLLPLLEKELTEKEFKSLKPNLDKTFIIENINESSSSIVICDLDEEFNKLKIENNVHAN